MAIYKLTNTDGEETMLGPTLAKCDRDVLFDAVRVLNQALISGKAEVSP